MSKTNHARRMRIAIMVRGVLPAPRPVDIMYSPLDIAVTISEQLTLRGHNITFYGSSDGGLKVTNIESCHLRPLVRNNQEWQALITTTDLFTDYIPSLYDQVLVQEMFKQAADGQYDLLHFHHPESAMPYSRLFPSVPVIYTLHDQIDTQRREIIEEFASSNQHFVSISNNQRSGAPSLSYAATIYNGVDTALFVPKKGEHENYLLCVGRIVPDKGIKEAVQVALATGLRLFIIGQVQDSEKWYFEAHIKPHLSDKILFLGHLEHTQLVLFYQSALALLMPVQWEEPFGLTMIEAMACGTPVIAFRRGSIPEIIIDGKTGYIVDTVKEMIEAVNKLPTIRRSSCRQHVIRNFSIDRMVSGYETVFKDTLKQSEHAKTAT